MNTSNLFSAILVTLTSVGALFSATSATFVFLEKQISKQGKADIAAYLKSDRAGAIAAHIPADFQSTFIRIFGDDHLSWRTLIRATMLTVIAGGLVLILVALNAPDHIQELLSDGISHPVIEVPLGKLILGTFVWAIWTIALTYIGLYKSRRLIDMIEASTLTLSRALIALFVDIAVSIAVFCAALLLIIYIFVYSSYSVILPDQYFINLAWYAAKERSSFQLIASSLGSLISGNNLLSVAFYTSLFPSAIVWLFLVATVVARASTGHQQLSDHIAHWFNIDERPVKIIGFVAAAVVSFIYLICRLISDLVLQS